MKLAGWKELFQNKVVGGDISVLFHSLFTERHPVGQLLRADANSSVYPLVSETMNAFFTSHCLREAKGIVFVHDPKLVKQFHCSSCEKAYHSFIDTKYTVTGRDRRQKSQVQQTVDWKKTVDTFRNLKDAAVKLEMEKGLSDKFARAYKYANVVTQPLHDAFVTWVFDYVAGVLNARELKKKNARHKVPRKKMRKECSNSRTAVSVDGGTGQVGSTPEDVDLASYPLMVCVNSPMEADDQLAYLQNCGFVDRILTVDSDLLALGCFNVVTKGLSRFSRTAKGYTNESVADRLAWLLQVPSAELLNNQAWMRQLLCLVSCTVGNDYVVGGLGSTEGVTKVRDFVRGRSTRDNPHTITTEDAIAVAKGIWAQVISNNRKRKLQQKYKDMQLYLDAFCQAFEIYSVGRHWHFQPGLDVEALKRNFDDFVLSKNVELVTTGLVQPLGCETIWCRGYPVPSDVFFVKKPKKPDLRMGKDINFSEFPPSALPDAVLEWWLMTRGCEMDNETTNRDELLKLAYMFHGYPVVPEASYKTTFSTVLYPMMKLTAHLPCLMWRGNVVEWKVSTNGEIQDLTQLRQSLTRCRLEMSQSAAIKKTRNELSKAEKMSRDGHVMWKTMAVSTGTIDTPEGSTDAVLFELQCLPSFKKDFYSVELVFVNTPRCTKLQLDDTLSYCTCKVGAITESHSTCSHRCACLTWLESLHDSWERSIAKNPLLVVENFNHLARIIQLPLLTAEASRLPLSIPCVSTLHKQAEQSIYLQDTKDYGENTVMTVLQNLIEANEKGLIKLTDFQQGALLAKSLQYAKTVRRQNTEQTAVPDASRR